MTLRRILLIVLALPVVAVTGFVMVNVFLIVLANSGPGA